MSCRESRILANRIHSELGSSESKKFTGTLHMLRSELAVDCDEDQIHHIPILLTIKKASYSSTSSQ
jgi:hypothetical protein